MKISSDRSKKPVKNGKVVLVVLAKTVKMPILNQLDE